MAIPLQAPTVEVQRGEYGAVEVESVLTVGLSNRRMTVECVAYNLVGISSDTFTVEVSGEWGKDFGMRRRTPQFSNCSQIKSDLIMFKCKNQEYFSPLNCADKLFTSTLTGAASFLAVLLLLLGFLLYKYKQVGCTRLLCQKERELHTNGSFLVHRNPDTRSAGRSLRPEMKTTTHSLTPLSCLTMTSGSFQETN